MDDYDVHGLMDHIFMGDGALERLKHYDLFRLRQYVLNEIIFKHFPEEDLVVPSSTINDKTIGRAITHGSYGSVHNVCLALHPSECNYVAKVIKIAKYSQDSGTTYRHFVTEVICSLRASTGRFGPRVGDVCICRYRDAYYGIIILEKYDYMIAHVPLAMDDIITIMNLIFKMTKSGIYHGDLFAKNILAKKNDRGSLDFAITDFGTAFLSEQSFGGDVGAFDIVSFLFGWYIPTASGWKLVGAPVADPNDIKKALQIYIDLDPKHHAQDVLHALQMRISQAATLENPTAKNEDGTVTTNPVLMYKTIFASISDEYLRYISPVLREYTVWTTLESVPDRSTATNTLVEGVEMRLKISKVQ